MKLSLTYMNFVIKDSTYEELERLNFYEHFHLIFYHQMVVLMYPVLGCMMVV
jgi:hypothetical protein